MPHRAGRVLALGPACSAANGNGAAPSSFACGPRGGRRGQWAAGGAGPGAAGRGRPPRGRAAERRERRTRGRCGGAGGAGPAGPPGPPGDGGGGGTGQGRGQRYGRGDPAACLFRRCLVRREGPSPRRLLSAQRDPGLCGDAERLAVPSFPQRGEVNAVRDAPIACGLSLYSGGAGAPVTRCEPPAKPSDTGVGTLDFPPRRFAHSESNAAVPAAPFSLLPFLSPFLVSVTGGLRMEGAPSPVAGPWSPRSPGTAASPFLLPGLKLLSFCLTSLYFWGGYFPHDGDPHGPPAFGQHGTAHAGTTGSHPGEMWSLLLAGVGSAPSLLPKTTGFFPKHCWEPRRSSG